MKISEAINDLVNLMAEFGDLPLHHVVSTDPSQVPEVSAVFFECDDEDSNDFQKVVIE